MERQVELGFVTQLGISNLHDVRRFERIYQEAAVKPRVLQNRFSPQLGHDAEIRIFCQRHGIIYQPFWVLSANGQQLQLPVHKSNIAALPLYPTHCMICAQEIAGRDGGGPGSSSRAGAGPVQLPAPAGRAAPVRDDVDGVHAGQPRVVGLRADPRGDARARRDFPAAARGLRRAARTHHDVARTARGVRRRAQTSYHDVAWTEVKPRPNSSS